jgi:high-affinity iron transporter
VLFLKAIALQSSSAVSLWGGLSGAALALGVTSAIFIGGRRVPLKALFRSTGAVLLFVAAGLLAYGIHELEELGWVPPLIAPVWNINHILNEKEGLGSFLKALFGYNGNPSLTEVLSYATYILVIFWALRRWRQREANQPAVTR